jgi:hypothetical protein
MLRHIARLAPITLFSLAIACGAPTEVAGPSGTYTLATINGKPLPGLVSRSSDRTIELLASTLTLTADRRFSFSARMRVTVVGGSPIETAESAQGSWELRGTIVDFTLEGSANIGVNEMAWDGYKTLTVNDPSGSVPVMMVFTR